jgi:RNA polymerase subunit RPABC4/transcription elongation factor Spt4
MEYDNDDSEQAMAQGRSNDLRDLRNADKQMPDTHKEKSLRACTGCRLVMSERQWEKNECVNCGHNSWEKTTAQFSGLISLMMPNHSWVAKWNNLEGMKPGIYAINILEELVYEEDINYHQTSKNNRRKQRVEND